MADEEHLAILKKGVSTWIKWRLDNPHIRPNFSEMDLSGMDLSRADLSRANLNGAVLRDTVLSGADLSWADLMGTDLTGADLSRTDLTEANLKGAHLFQADLFRTNLSQANLSEAIFIGAAVIYTNLRGADISGTDFSQTVFLNTVFIDVDLSQAQGLDTCVHLGPSFIDYHTLRRSGRLPLPFLRGCGLADNFIDYLPSLLDQPIQLYSCFISYSTKDDRFVRRLHADLQDRGVRCWLASEDMKWGAKQWDAIDEAIRLRDKVLLVLSKDSIESAWVEDEVTKAFAEERKRKRIVLFPVRIDDAIMRSRKPWASKLRNDRNIGDFRNWTDPDAYEKSLERALKDLTVEKKGKGKRRR